MKSNYKLTNEQFLEALIRLAWDEGYELALGYNESPLFEVTVKNGSLRAISKIIQAEVLNLDIHRILFDHDFIKVLCELNGKFLGEAYEKHWRKDMCGVILEELALEEFDRINVLREHFEDLATKAQY